MIAAKTRSENSAKRYEKEVLQKTKEREYTMNYKRIIPQMTLEEKCSLLSGETQFTSKSLRRLNIPEMYLSDGPHGVRRQKGRPDHLGMNASEPSTCYPTAATVANSWNLKLGEELGRHLGIEAKAQRVNVLLGPGLNIKRSPLCGRNFEYFSEDPYLSGKMAAAYIRGIQSQGIAACPKHFAVNSQEHLRMHSDSVLDERTLREIYLTGFEIAVKEGKPLGIMSSYNKVNGIYANENRKLLQDILAEEWGFDGIVVTDWGASNDRVEGLKAGNQLEMPGSNGNSDREVATAVREGRLSEKLLDKRLEEYLKVLFSCVISEKESTAYDEREHHAFARKAAVESVVLLKNQEEVLPLKPGTKIAVIGNFACEPKFQGGGSSAVNATKVDTALGCLRETQVDVIGYNPGFSKTGKGNQRLREEACELAARAEVVLLFLGLDERQETEGRDRPDMKLPPEQNKLLEEIRKINENIVVILTSGAPVELPWLHKCKALVHGYLGGQAGAGAITDVLVGKADPSGKLAETWPMHGEDAPCDRYYPGTEKTAEYREGIFVGYRYYETAGVTVQFPFGFGLSYTTFSYSNLTVNREQVTFTLKNTGKTEGAEIAQLYVAKSKGNVFRPLVELKGFAKVMLQPGEEKEVVIPLDDMTFRYYNVKTARWETEGGEYEIRIGSNCQECKLKGVVVIEGTTVCDPYLEKSLSSYQTANVRKISDREFEELLGHKIPEKFWNREIPLNVNDTFYQLAYAKGMVGKLAYWILYKYMKRSEKKKSPDLNILFIFGMPFRGLAKMTGGAFDMRMTEAIVELFNGYFFKGIGHLIVSGVCKCREARKWKKILNHMD